MLRCGDDEAAVTGSILLAETMHDIRVVALTLGMKDVPLPELPKVEE